MPNNNTLFAYLFQYFSLILSFFYFVQAQSQISTEFINCDCKIKKSAQLTLNTNGGDVASYATTNIFPHF